MDDLGVIIMGNRCSIQQGEENNCWLEQSPEKSTVSTVPLFLGHPVYIDNDSINFIHHTYKTDIKVQHSFELWHCTTKPPKKCHMWIFSTDQILEEEILG